MRVFTTSFTALLALVAFGPGTTGTALGGDTGTNVGTSVGTAGAAGAPALPPTPAPVAAPTLAPARPPTPVPTFAPAPVPSRTPAGQARDEVGNPGIPQTPGTSANAGVAANQSGDQWRYRWHNGTWWYWTSDNRWIYSNGNQWFNYEPAVAAVPDAPYSSQPVYGYYQFGPNGYYPGPYRYSTGYGSYYGPAYQGGYYYGPGGYYGRPGVSVGLGFGRGLRIGF